jgi:hypothetical protein
MNSLNKMHNDNTESFRLNILPSKALNGFRSNFTRIFIKTAMRI